MYALLPAMQGANSHILLQAIQEMIDHYKDDKPKLSNQFVWMGIILRRAKMLSPEDRLEVQEKLSMFDSLWNEDPVVQKMMASAIARAKEEAEATVKAEAEAKLQLERQRMVEAMQEVILGLVAERFPDLSHLAKENIDRITSFERSQELLKLLAVAPDENVARFIIVNFGK